MVGRSPPLLDRATRQLREPAAAAADADGDNRAAGNVEPMYVVRSEIPHLAQRVPDLGLAGDAQGDAAHRAVIGHPQEDHPAVGIGERHRRLGDAGVCDALLELDVMPLGRELGRELPGREFGGRRVPVIGTVRTVRGV